MLSGGEEIEADLVVAATGLVLQPIGGVRLSVDGEPVALGETMIYKGAMFSGVPNLVSVFGYFTASWTLKADLIAQCACRLINHMEARGYRQCVAVNGDPRPERAPLVDFSAGHFRRGIDLMPKQGAKPPWRWRRSYARDLLALKFGRLEDGALRFSRAPAAQERSAAR
jgi:cation diffusion facilitator CzcD-associated flavoprotein CzcO